MTREEAKIYIGELKMYAKSQGWDEEYQIACDVAMNELEQEPILDKIRAEIEQIVSRYSISRERGGMGQVEWSDRLIKESEVLKILDKYKADKEQE